MCWLEFGHCSLSAVLLIALDMPTDDDGDEETDRQGDWQQSGILAGRQAPAQTAPSTTYNVSEQPS